VDKVALGCRELLLITEQPNFVADAPIAKLGNAKTGVHCVWKADGLKESALGFNDQADYRTILGI
jgi:meiotically up-regulated gene 157 (Mug157) protein